MRPVLARENDGVDVLDHEALVADIRVSGYSARQGERNADQLAHGGACRVGARKAVSLGVDCSGYRASSDSSNTQMVRTVSTLGPVG